MVCLLALTIDEQIKAIEEEIEKTQYNKKTQGHIGLLKAKIARLKMEQEKRRAASGGVSFPHGPGGGAVYL